MKDPVAHPVHRRWRWCWLTAGDVPSSALLTNQTTSTSAFVKVPTTFCQLHFHFLTFCHTCMLGSMLSNRVLNVHSLSTKRMHQLVHALDCAYTFMHYAFFIFQITGAFHSFASFSVSCSVCATMDFDASAGVFRTHLRCSQRICNSRFQYAKRTEPSLGSFPGKKNLLHIVIICKKRSYWPLERNIKMHLGSWWFG